MVAENAQLKSERVLETIRQSRRAKDVVDVEMDMVKVVVFMSGGVRYGFYGSDVREILPPCQISWVPGLPGFLPGLINIRGDIESVIDLRQVLGGEPVNAEKCQVAMVVRGGFRSGVLIDSIDDVMDLPVNAVKPPLSTLSGAARDLVAGEIEHDGMMITLLDTEKLAAKVRL